MKKSKTKTRKNISKVKKNKYKRPLWDDYFMEVANSISKRGTCDRGRSGCVIAKDNQILVSGYVGSPKGFPHCDEVGHQIKKLVHENGLITQHCVRTVHAEQNAICQAAKRGVSIDGATLYVKMTPCRTCAMLLINVGIKRVVCEKKYHAGNESEKMFKNAGIKIEYKTNKLEKYKKQ
jgi:dCMP deaminase